MTRYDMDNFGRLRGGIQWQIATNQFAEVDTPFAIRTLRVCGGDTCYGAADSMWIPARSLGYRGKKLVRYPNTATCRQISRDLEQHILIGRAEIGRASCRERV